MSRPATDRCPRRSQPRTPALPRSSSKTPAWWFPCDVRSGSWRGSTTERTREPQPLENGGEPTIQLAAWRRAYALTQRALAARAGLTAKAVIGIEQGTRPREATIAKLADVFHVLPLALYREPELDDLSPHLFAQFHGDEWP